MDLNKFTQKAQEAIVGAQALAGEHSHGQIEPEHLLLAAAALRLVLMIPATNQWNSAVPPQPWALYRNLPLMLLGLGTAYLILHDARTAQDRSFTWIAIMILVSYACYTPVILFVQQAPLIGMLMIPKTVAYVAIGLIAYFRLYRPAASVEGVGATANGPS